MDPQTSSKQFESYVIGNGLFSVTIYRVYGDVHKGADHIHARSPEEFELFPVGVRIGVILSLNVQTYCFLRHVTSYIVSGTRIDAAAEMDTTSYAGGVRWSSLQRP